MARALSDIKREAAAQAEAGGGPLSDMPLPLWLAARGLPSGYRKIGLNISAEDLRDRARRRVRAMLKKGLLEETEAFVKKGFADWRPLHSLGYKECLLCLKGRLKRGELEDEIVLRTLRLAKKQKTWFRRDKSVVWRDFRDDPVQACRGILTARQENRKPEPAQPGEKGREKRE